MGFDAMVVTAHPGAAEVQIGGTNAKLTRKGVSVPIVDLCNGEPADFAEP